MKWHLHWRLLFLQLLPYANADLPQLTSRDSLIWVTNPLEYAARNEMFAAILDARRAHGDQGMT